MFLSLEVDHNGPSVYKRDLEPVVLRESEVFYKAEGERLLDSCDAPEYLQRVCFFPFFSMISEFSVGPGSLRIRSVTNAPLLVIPNCIPPPPNPGGSPIDDSFVDRDFSAKLRLRCHD